MILIATNDLFFRVKIEEVAKQKNVKIKFIENSKEVENTSLLIVDLNFDKFPAEAIRKIKQENPGIYIIGYLSHVQTKLKEDVLRAGCDEVIPRSQFSVKLGDILVNAARNPLLSSSE